MFEGKLPLPSARSGSKHGDSVAGELCKMEWSDLVAKLAAARDLRDELGDGEDCSLASFDPNCAAHIASHHDKPPVDGKHGVNLDGLVKCKGTGGIVDADIGSNDPAIRGNS